MPAEPNLISRRGAYDAVRTTEVYALLLGLAGVMMIATLALPGPPERDSEALLLIAAVTIILAALLDLTRHRIPRYVPLGLPTLGTALVAAAAYVAGDVAVGAYAMLFFLVALPAAYLLPPGIALPQVALAAAACAVALLLADALRLSALYAVVGSVTLGLIAGILVALRSGERRLVSWLERAAATDSVTGLANRSAFGQRTEQELHRAMRSGQPFSVIVVDLDRFKAVNDRLGHLEGDSVLARSGAALSRNARAADTVARLGGDEFGILLPETAGGDAFEVANRMRVSIERTFSDAPQPITGSFGIAAFPDDAQTASELLHCADEAMYAAKRSGRNRARRYLHLRVTSLHERPVRADGDRLDPRLGALLSVAEEVERRKGGSDAVWRAALVADGLAQTLGMDRFRREQVQLAARLRDVGLVGLPEELLRRAEPLEEGDWRTIHRHPQIGARMLVGARLDPELGQWILCHHENVDGSGYPRGLHGEEIPIEARIVAVADAYTAMQTPRPWRAPLTPEAARTSLLEETGTHFDPKVVEALVALSGEPR
jgi:diguanylate cyclase (GGDEF)-like protein